MLQIVVRHSEFNQQIVDYSAAASVWALAHPELGSSGGQIMPTTLLLAHPDLKTQRHLWYVLLSKVRGRFRKILWPSQNI